MTEKNLALDQDPLSYAAAADNLAFFLRETGADHETASEYDRRIMASVPLTVQLEPLHAESGSDSERDKLVSYFEANDWLPKQLQEANIAAIKGVDETLRRARHTSQGDQTEAQISTHTTIKRYFTDALHDVQTLNLVRTRREGRYMVPNIGSLRVTRPALYTIADMLLAQEFLDNAEWANSNWAQYAERQRYWRGFMLFAAQYGTDKVLANAFNHFYEKAQNRRRFWSDELSKIDRSIGHLVTRQMEPAGSSTEDVKYEPEEQSPVKAEELTDFEALIPEGAEKDLKRAIQEYASKSARIDHLTEIMTRAEAERTVLGGRALYYQGQLVGVEAEEEKISGPRRPSRDPKTRRGLHGQGLMNADEPPPGIPDARRDRTG